MELENLNHLSNLSNTNWLNTFWHRQYVIFSGLTQFGNDNPWQHSSCVGLAESDVTVMPSVTSVTEYTGDMITQVM
jgi:hypothetical protein